MPRNPHTPLSPEELDEAVSGLPDESRRAFLTALFRNYQDDLSPDIRRGLSPVGESRRGFLQNIMLLMAGGALTVGGVELASRFNPRVQSPLDQLKGVVKEGVCEGDLDRRVSGLEVPEGISDTGLILYTSIPIFDQRTKETYDTILDVDALSKWFLQDRLQILDMEESRATWSGYKERVYHLTIPGEENGEVLSNGRGRHQMQTTKWPDVLNLITRAAESTDDDVIKYLVWWYRVTYSISLDADSLEIVRGNDKTIENIFYRGANKKAEINFRAAETLDRVPESSARGRRNTYTAPKPLTASNDRLLLWTGVGQDLLVPESFLIDANKKFVDLDLNDNENKWGGVRFSWRSFADSIRHYIDHRDDVQTFVYNDPRTGEVTSRNGLNHYVAPNDPIVAKMVEIITKGATTRFEIVSRIKLFFQHNTNYDVEAGNEVNRPITATLMQGWGDCNNLTVGMASLLKAAGIRTAIVHAVNDPSKMHKVDRRWKRSSHVLLAIHKDDLKDSGIEYPAWNIGGDNPLEWVLFDPSSKTSDLGEFSLGDRMKIIKIREIQ